MERLLKDISTKLDTSADVEVNEAQLADLRDRVKNPGPRATPERVAAVLAKFKI